MRWGAERSTRGKSAKMADALGPTLLSSGEASKVRASIDPEILEFERHIEERKKKDAPASALLTEVVERVPSLTFADGAIIALVEQEGDVVCRASTGTGPVVGSRLQPQSGLTKECFASQRVVVCEDTENDSRVGSSIAKRLRLRSAVAVPIMAEGTVLGVVEVLSSRPSAFDSTHVARLLRVAQLLASILAPGRAQSEKSVEENRRAWLVPAGAALVLPILLLLLVESHDRPRKTLTATRAMPNSGVAKRNEAVRGPTGTARDTLEAQGSSRAEVNSPTVSSSEATEEPSAGGASSNKWRSATPGEQKETLASLASAGARPVAKPGWEVVREQVGSVAPVPVNPPDPLLVASAKAPPVELGPTRTIPVLTTAVPTFNLGVSFKAHSNWVTSVAFSPDGKRLFSSSWDQTIKLWAAAADARGLGTFKLKAIQAMAVSRDGRWLALENLDNAIVIWDALAEREVLTLPGKGGSDTWVYSIAFSPDGLWLATGLDNRTVRLWNVRTWHAFRDYRGEERKVIYTAFSPDGQWLATGKDGKTIEIWDVVSGKKLAALSGHKKDVYAVSFSPDGRWLASASADKTIKLWNWPIGREIRTFTGHQGNVTSLSFSPNGRWLASGSWDDTVKIWNVETGQAVQTLTGDHHVYAVSFSPDGRRLASGSEDGTIRLWLNSR